MLVGFALGLVAQNAGEWLAHKYILHGMARKKDSFWAFHWHEHHKESRRNDFYDPHYQRSLFSGLHAQSKEALGLAAGVRLATPAGRRGRLRRRSCTSTPPRATCRPSAGG